VSHERQCSACGFTFGGNLAIGSPLCGPCLDLNMSNYERQALHAATAMQHKHEQLMALGCERFGDMYIAPPLDLATLDFLERQMGAVTYKPPPKSAARLHAWKK
jgi:hypothetical protein